MGKEYEKYEYASRVTREGCEVCLVVAAYMRGKLKTSTEVIVVRDNFAEAEQTADRLNTILNSQGRASARRYASMLKSISK